MRESKEKVEACLLRFWFGLILIAISSKAFAQSEETPVVLPYKVSELNTSVFKFLYELGTDTSAAVWEGIISLTDFVETADWIYHSFSQPAIREQFVEFSIEFLASLLIAFAFERLLTLYLRPAIKIVRHKQAWEHFWRDFVCVCISLTPIAVFGVSFYFSFRLLEPVSTIYLEIATVFINGVTAAWAFIRASKQVLIPKDDKSHLPFTKPLLHSVHGWIRRIVIVILAGYFIEEIGQLIRLPDAGHKLVLQITTFVILLFSARLVWLLDGEFTQWLYKRRKAKNLPSWKKRFLAFMHLSPFLFVYLMTLLYLTWVLPVDETLRVAWKVFSTVLLLPILFYGQHLVGSLQRHWTNQHLVRFAPEAGEKAQFYQNQIGFVLGSLLTILFALFMVWFWNEDPLFFIHTDLGRLISEKALSFLVIFGLALFVLKAGKGVVGHYLNPTGTRGLTASDKARMKTLHSIIISVLQVFIWVPAALLILAELDIDILPAAAIIGVLGVGLSLGLQSIVADFVTGLFMLVENTFAVGDTIEVNGKVGSVESLTVRVLRLRAMDGTVSSFPYGKIDKIANFTRQYSVAVMTFPVGRGEDMEKIYTLICNVDTALHKENKLVQSVVVEPIQIDGVIEATDSAFTLRVRVKTKPNEHWAIKRLYTQRILDKFDSEDVKRGHVTRRILRENYNMTKDVSAPD